MAPKITRYTSSQKNQIIGLRKDPVIKETLWDWEFVELADLLGQEFNPVVLTDGERVVGFNGTLPVTLRYDTEYISGIWSCDFYVDDSYRGKGLGQAIKKELITRAPVIMSLGVSPMAARVLLKMGWKCRNVPVYRKVKRRSGPHSMKQLLRTLAVDLVQMMNRLRYRKVPLPALSIDWSDGLPEKQAVDDLASLISDGYRKTIVRSYDYLRWKYLRHPLARYQFGTARSSEGELQALLVVRASQETIKIVDYLGPVGEVGVKRALINSCCQRYSEAAQFSITTSDEAFSRALGAEGFGKTRSSLGFYVRSSLGDSDPEEGWFIMGGDSDGELLAAANESLTGLTKNKGE